MSTNNKFGTHLEFVEDIDSTDNQYPEQQHPPPQVQVQLPQPLILRRYPTRLFQFVNTGPIPERGGLVMNSTLYDVSFPYVELRNYTHYLLWFCTRTMVFAHAPFVSCVNRI